jgi:hypothetical protein
MRARITVFTFAMLIAATGTLCATEIYKSTDEEGNVHYGDRPTVGAERLTIQSRPTDSVRIQSDAQARVDEQTRRAEEGANAPQGPTPEEQRAQVREREEECNKYQERQTRFTNNRRIYRMDENGERVYYDEDEMQAARDRVDGLVTKYCD